jgi:hypothetical protein
VLLRLLNPYKKDRGLPGHIFQAGGPLNYGARLTFLSLVAQSGEVLRAEHLLSTAGLGFPENLLYLSGLRQRYTYHGVWQVWCFNPGFLLICALFSYHILTPLRFIFSLKLKLSKQPFPGILVFLADLLGLSWSDPAMLFVNSFQIVNENLFSM